MKFSEKLLKLRKDFGLNQYEVATQVGACRKTVTFWEHGYNTPNVEKLIELSKLYDVSLDELLSEELAETEIAPVNVQSTFTELPFCEKISMLRSHIGLTQREMAESLDVSYTSICRWETGERQPSVPTLVKLSKFLGIPIDELLYDEMKREPERDFLP